MTTPGAIISDRRKQLGKTQRDLADELELSQGFLWRLEHDDATPSDEVVSRIARALELSPDVIYAALGKAPPDIRQMLAQLSAEQLAELRAYLSAVT